ncbi:zinc-finger domain-containing protein [Ruminococcus flavefaciens]|uniref:zinc-finger domain-containing protein n=1 Tax=Ruminococcus flavefaciens TaxID=1265 RepID=UPI003D2B8735
MSSQLLSREQDTSLCFLISATNHKTQGRHLCLPFCISVCTLLTASLKERGQWD